MFSYTAPTAFNASSFSIFKNSMMQSDDLPLAEIIDADQWQAVFAKYEIDFGDDENVVYTPAITLWALISQVFFKDEQRSCLTAVARVAALWATLGKRVCSTSTGAYCRARLKIKFEAVREIARSIAASAEACFEQQRQAELVEADVNLVHAVVAEVQAHPMTGRVLLVDGFTVSAADTAENQLEFPQPNSQKEGLGFPVIRCVSLISMVTGLLVDLAFGAYSGKQSGETALLWKMLSELKPGDTLVADCFYCTYWLVAACKLKGVHIVMKNHDKRDDDPIGARRINKHERVVIWLKPKQPDWMSDEEYQQLPQTLEIRLVDLIIEQAGFRSKKFTVATTIMDRQLYTRRWITSLYRSRWLVELDIRAIKCSLGMDILRAKTPAMLKTELWSGLLAYNLLRMKMLQSCAANGRLPRTLSFTASMQMIASSWLLCAVTGVSSELAELGQHAASSKQVGHRPDRIEPRANKRRPKLLALLTKPRHEARQALILAI